MQKKSVPRSTPLRDDDIRDPTLLAAGLLMDAKSYLKAARALAGQEIWSPEYFLLCHAMELILKSYLAARGATEKELKQLSHHLVRTYARARKKGFCPSDARTAGVIRWLSPFHEDLVFRYRKSIGSVQYPAASDVADVVSRLIRQIEPIVRGRFRASRV
jgi:hypothetical protein